ASRPRPRPASERGGVVPAARLAPAGKVVVRAADAEVRDLVAQRVPVHAQGLGGAAEVPTVRLQGSDDELALELPPRLLESEPAADQLVDDLIEPSVEVLFGHGASKKNLYDTTRRRLGGWQEAPGGGSVGEKMTTTGRPREALGATWD